MNLNAQGEQFTMTVVRVDECAGRYREQYEHFIYCKREDGTDYFAKEVVNEAKTAFVVGRRNRFTVTAPGRAGKPDWIRFTALELDPLPKYDEQHIGGNMYHETAITAFKASVDLGIKNSWTNDQILENAYYFAGNIVKIGRTIAQDFS